MDLIEELKKLLGIERKKNLKEEKLREDEFFVARARKQFERLSRRGLSIPIVTL